jgi:hypothetical protein
MAEFSSCMKCNFETTEPFTHCPQCGRRMLNSSKVRMLGWLLVCLGGFLVVMMAAITILIAVNFSHFTGTAIQATLMFVLFAVIIAFGLLSLAAGTWQIKHGKRNKTIMFIGMGLGFLLVLTTLATLRVLG